MKIDVKKMFVIVLPNKQAGILKMLVFGAFLASKKLADDLTSK